MSSQDHLPQPATERDPITCQRSLATAGNTAGLYLQQYFRSGWAFFIPYLAAYLLYAWLRWPVNPVTGDTPPATDSVHLSPFSLLLPPSLLHVYWVLHAVHLVLGAFAIRSWLRQTSLLHSPFSLLLKAAPWLCLALLFYIPGIYLEWPSDPWEHLRRINEWRILEQVTAHSSWKKSSYFLPYSLTQHVTGLTQLSWLNFYYTAVCLLLSWQYYRLARALGWESRYALGFVILNMLSFGNSAFSFYRYYSLSSSIVAQICAIALVRVTVEYGARYLAPAHGKTSAPGDSLPVTIWAAAGALLLMTCIAANHLQGVMIAGLGVMSVGTWLALRLLRPRLVVAFVLVFGAINLAAYFWWPRHPVVSHDFVASGWLTRLHTYDFSPQSISGTRCWQIIGVFGAFDLICALLIPRRAPPASSWLALGPLLWLSTPVIAIPLANILAQHSPNSVYAFHRVFFAIPFGLAFVAAFRGLNQVSRSWAIAAKAGMVALLPVLLASPAGSPGFNRIWHLLAVVPRDLALGSMRDQLATTERPAPASGESIAPAPLAYARAASHPTSGELPARINPAPPSTIIHARVALLQNQWPPPGFDQQGLPARHPDLRSAKKSVTEGQPPRLAPVEWTPGRELVVLENDKGTRADVLLDASTIEPGATYTVEAVVRQTGKVSGAHYLAIAWYDAFGHRLDAAAPAPSGAGSPAGWDNGVYSYFGLVGASPPSDWTIYRQSFGGESAARIPPHAHSMRAAVRFNYTGAADAQMQVASLVVWKRREDDPTIDGVFRQNARFDVQTAPATFPSTPGSFAARTANHWLPFQLALDLGGSQQLEDAAKRKGLPVRIVPAGIGQ